MARGSIPGHPWVVVDFDEGLWDLSDENLQSFLDEGRGSS